MAKPVARALFTIFLAVTSEMHSQSTVQKNDRQTTDVVVVTPKWRCAFFESHQTHDPITTYPPDLQAAKMLDEITQFVPPGTPSFKLRAAAVENCEWCVCEDNSRLILYQYNFLKSFKDKDRSDKWEVRGIIAHEIGHHLQYVEGSNEPRRQIELAADRAAGWILAMMGAKDAEATAAVMTLPEEGPPNYPSREERRIAVLNGWASFTQRPNVVKLDDEEEQEELNAMQKRVAENVEVVEPEKPAASASPKLSAKLSSRPEAKQASANAMNGAQSRDVSRCIIYARAGSWLRLSPQGEIFTLTRAGKNVVGQRMPGEPGFVFMLKFPDAKYGVTEDGTICLPDYTKGCQVAGRVTWSR